MHSSSGVHFNNEIIFIVASVVTTASHTTQSGASLGISLLVFMAVIIYWRIIVKFSHIFSIPRAEFQVKSYFISKHFNSSNSKTWICVRLTHFYVWYSSNCSEILLWKIQCESCALNIDLSQTNINTVRRIALYLMMYKWYKADPLTILGGQIDNFCLYIAADAHGGCKNQYVST